MAKDLSGAVIAWLQVNADTAAIRNLLISGANSVFDSRVDASVLVQLAAARETAGTFTKALALIVHDVGEDAEGKAYIVLRILDRGVGVGTIRNIRELIMRTLHNQDFLMDDNTTALELRFRERGGFDYDPAYAVDYEALSFEAHIYRPFLRYS